VTHETQPRPFDEQAALAELERLADKIQISRRQRAQALAEFDAFVKTFRDEPGGAIHAAEAAAPALTFSTPPSAIVPHAAPSAVAVVVSPTEAGRRDSPDTNNVWREVAARGQVVPVASSQRADARSPYIRPLLAALAVAIVAITTVWWRPWTTAPLEPASPAVQPAPAATPSTSSPPTAPKPTPAAEVSPVRALNVELTTIRRVWTRVTVDDRRVIERELPAGERIPLGADRMIAIRAGDAGAIRLTVDGKDQGPLGRDGQIGTRTLTAKQ
jgi:hypothetical protein